MAQNAEIAIPIICENDLCENFGKAINVIDGISESDLGLFYESYDGGDENDYCPVCGQLGVAEEPFLRRVPKS